MTASAGPGSSFTGWAGDINTSANPIDVTLDDDKAISAGFTLDEYTLSVTSDHGTVARSPEQTTYHYGDVVKLTATPDPDYAFAYWSGAGVGPSNPVQITIHGDTEVTANYIQNGRTLTVISENGTVARSPDQAVYQDGDVVRLTATPVPGFTFTDWSGDINDTSNPIDVTIQGDTSVTANYILTEYTLTIVSEHGTVARSPDQASYHHGDVVRLTVTPEADYTFSGWSGDADGSLNPFDLTIQGDTVLTANYTVSIYTLNVTKSGTGSGHVQSDPAGIDCGTDCTEPYTASSLVTLTASPALYSHFGGWSGGGCSGMGACTLELHADTTVNADFITYWLYLPMISKPVPPPAAFNKNLPGDGSLVGKTATLSWGYSAGATGYEYCLDTIDNSTCDAAWVPVRLASSATVHNLLPKTIYFWQVRAVNDGGATYADGGRWFNFHLSWYPKAGFWWDSKYGTYFYVTPDQTIVREFSIHVNMVNCFKGWISRTVPDGDTYINNDHTFPFDGSFWNKAAFTSETTASGTSGLSDYYACGLYWTGSYSWKAVWYDKSQPTSMSPQAQELKDQSVEKDQGTTSGFEVFPEK